MSAMCFDPNHRLPPPPPAKAVFADLAGRLATLQAAWEGFRDSGHRPSDWVRAEREIGQAASAMLSDCERARRHSEGL